MKFLKSISVLSLITLSNVIQASYISINETTCLKVKGNNGKLKPVECELHKASQFVLGDDDKLCLTDDAKNCLSRDGSKLVFSTAESIHVEVVFNEGCGCLYPANHTHWYYSYNMENKMFVMHGDNKMLNTGVVDGLWKNGDKCWTTKLGTKKDFTKITRQKCRSEKVNQKQWNKTQSWKFVDGKISTSDDQYCVAWNGKSKVGSSLCSKHYTDFVVTDSSIYLKNNPDMCLTDLSGSIGLAIGKCLTKIKLVDFSRYTVFKPAHITYSQVGNVARIGNVGSYSWSAKFGAILFYKHNWNYYTLKMIKTEKYTNFGVATPDVSRFTLGWGGDLGYDKTGLACFSGGGYKRIYNRLGGSRLDNYTTQEYKAGSTVKVIKTDTYVEFRCSSCGDTLIWKHIFKTGDATNLYPALDVYYHGDSYEMVVY